MSIEELCRLVDETAASSTNWHVLAVQLQRPPGGPDDPIPAFVAAFHYMLYPITEESGREGWGPFAPVFEGPRGVFPSPLPEIADRWLTLWADVAQSSTSAVVRSRLHDLLWERRLGARPDLHARQAIDAYVALTGSSWSSVDRAFGLIRALELARSIRDHGRLATVLTACENGARESMIASSHEPGVALRLIRALMWLPPDLQPLSIDDLLAQAEGVYGADPHHFASIVDLKVSRSRDAAFVRQLRIQQVERWRHRAGEAAGLLRFAHLQTALETARNRPLRPRRWDPSRHAASRPRLEAGRSCRVDLGRARRNADLYLR